jgi:calpain
MSQGIQRAPPSSSTVPVDLKIEATRQRAMDKLVKFVQALIRINVDPIRFFNRADIDSSQNLNMSEFSNAMNALKVGLDASEANLLFQHFDTNKDRLISVKEFVQAIEVEAQKLKAPGTSSSVSQPVANPSKVPTNPPNPTAKATAAALSSSGVSQESVTSQLKALLAKRPYQPTDRFMDRNSIFNDPIAALKFCYEQVDQLAKKPKDKNGKQLYDDPDFGPNINDVHGWNSICFSNPFPGAPSPSEFSWCRLHEICPNPPPVFLVEGATADDVNQGALGDCWMIGAMSILAMKDELIRGSYTPTPQTVNSPITEAEAKSLFTGVYPPIFHHLRHHGIYVLRFYKNFGWKYVVMDDKIPCLNNPTTGEVELFFASCTKKHEFWVPLMEKAYAKIHGAYQALISGDVSDALTDFSGYVSNKLTVLNRNQFNKAALKDPETFWKLLETSIKNGSLCGCSIVGAGIETAVILDGNDTGLYAGHAYSIQGVYTIRGVKDGVEGQHRLVRVRNPWGCKNPKEWTGAWCDDSTEFTDNIDEINRVMAQVDGSEVEKIDREFTKDGTFFMSYEDFIRIWTKVSLCVKFSNGYQSLRFINEWKGETAGGTPLKPSLEPMWAKNTQYFIKVSKKTNVFISLGQNDGRLLASDTNVFPFIQNTHTAVIVVIKAGSDKPEPKMGKAHAMSTLKQFKEVSLEVDLDPGMYMIVPSTKDAGQEGKYYLTIYHNGGSDVVLKNATTGEAPKPVSLEDDAYATYDERLKMLLKQNCSLDLVR